MNRPPVETPTFVGKPRIGRIGPADSGRSGLDDYLMRQTRPWRQVPVLLPGPVTAALWSVLLTNIGLSVWLALVVRGTAPCSGPACTIATWERPMLLLALAGNCVVLLAGALIVTRGLTEAGAIPLCALLLGSATGVVAMSGLVALVLIALAGLALTVSVVVAVASRL